DATLPVYAVQPLETALQQQTSTARFGSWLLAVFSVGALLLSAIGLYGLVSYVVGLSRREIAIRMALGANARRVVGLITGNGLTLVCAGIVMGVAGGVLAGRALQSQLFQTTAYDVKILAIVSLLMLSASAAAILIPTRHAVRVDPHAALRAD
ncbi:MAG TPA: FtsX-like permease family protein, partial [Vicinamibacterales bacterium]|nr:FtsX-like permease family protein [Vicinamibacterales bacterium]